MIKEIQLAIIGGSGLYEMGGIQETEEINLDTPFGKPSAPIITGVLSGHRIAFLARHGISHQLTPSEVPYLANIYALKSIGVDRILGISACGSLREDYAPGDIVIPDQLYDNTKNRPRTFFGNGFVGHISIADPFCEDFIEPFGNVSECLRSNFSSWWSSNNDRGPRFSTRVESNIYRSWGISLIGMTAAPEAFLAREAEICYAVLAHVTDYDVWRISEEPVTVDMVIQTLNKNTLLAQSVIENLVLNLTPSRSCNCGQALSSALITQRKAIPSTTIKKLEPIIKKYFKNQEY